MKILVLMSTYNGERYIKEQIDSIISQEKVKVELLIRDDGSNDSTLEILEEYANNFDNIRYWSGGNVGFVNSFSELMKKALDCYSTADYYAFVDQDDVWHSSKLWNACVKLAKYDNSKPCLYQSNSIVINSDGIEQGEFISVDINKFKRGSSMIFGTVQGCGMVFNKAAVYTYNRIPPQKSWHDRWLYLICFYLGTSIYDPTPQFYYRIHNNNTLACNVPWYENLKKQVKGFLKHPLHQVMAEEFYLKFYSELSDEDKKIFSVYLSYRYNLLSKAKLIFSSNFKYPYPKGYPLYLLKIILGRV